MTNSLLMDLYELTMAQAYFVYKRGTFATFDLFVRELPRNRAYLVACGLEDVLNYLKGLRFVKEDIDYLKKQRLFSKDFLGYLANFRFKGDVWAMPEGTIFFANEPIIRVTAPVIEAQIIESFLLNTINLQTMIASKASRVVCAAGDKALYDFSLRRTHGADAGIKVGRSSYIAGFSGSSNVLAGKLYHIPIVGTMAHSFVMSFKQEMDSFLAYSNIFPERTILLVDTYDAKKGIENAVTIGLYLKEKACRLQGIRLDSGDIVSLSKLARRMLDKAGLNYVKIFASGNLDEFKIQDLLKRGARLDCFGVGTNMGTSIDAPCLDVIYKISEVTDEEGRFLPTMKLSKGKVTYPGRKQVFRVQDKKGRYIRDILGLEKEKLAGKPLLIRVIEGGRLIYKVPSLDRIRIFTKASLSRFPQRLKEVALRFKYPVTVSPGL
ncbi:MAG: nicotinate phosphoribosyltransferase, partial [Candidatus Omnitrophica bacterium]|nr:nicotinate phosphoribosyltransferase [Candidatus Omnitrophota bacterium]